MRLLIFLLAATPLPALVHAQPADPTCAGARAELPPELSAWGDQNPISAGVKPGEGATLEIGQAALVSLHPAKHLVFDLPAKSPPDANGGTLALAIAKPGTYRIALGDAARVDLLLDGKLAVSKAHAHGPRCSGVRKIVDFALTPGNYTVQLSGSSDDTVALLVARAG